MERDELLKALRRAMPEPGSLHCLGCGYEHNCSLHGCAVIREAVEEIMRLAVENEALRRGAYAPDRPLSQAERDALLEWPPDSLPNPPLTLEELREMEGGPSVWVVIGKRGFYDVFCDVSTDGIAQFYRAALPEDEYGKTWLAYRRKPEEGTDDNIM